MSASNIIKRILGLVMLLVGLGIMVISLAGSVYVGEALESISQSINNTLDFTSDTLETARESILLTQATVSDVGSAMDTAVTTTADLSKAVADSQPFIDSVNKIVSQQLPENIEAIQSTLPNVIQVAAVIDSTLTGLANIGIDRTIDLPLGQSIPLKFDLGIEYAPEESFDQTLSTFSTSLDGLPENLRAIEDELAVTNDNLGILSDDLLVMSDDLAQINEQTAELVPMMDEYIRLIDDVITSLADAQERIPAQLETLRLGAIVGLILLGLSQLVSVYVGWELVSGQRDSLTPEQMETVTTLASHDKSTGAQVVEGGVQNEAPPPADASQ